MNPCAVLPETFEMAAYSGESRAQIWPAVAAAAAAAALAAVFWKQQGPDGQMVGWTGAAVCHR